VTGSGQVSDVPRVGSDPTSSVPSSVEQHLIQLLMRKQQQQQQAGVAVTTPQQQQALLQLLLQSQSSSSSSSSQAVRQTSTTGVTAFSLANLPATAAAALPASQVCLLYLTVY